MPRARLLAIFSLSAAIVAAGCSRPPGERLRVIDLLEHEASAEKRPAGGAFEIREYQCGGVSRTALAVPAGSRVIWPTMLPARGVLAAGAAVEGEPGASVTFRVGISDDRVYEGLQSIQVSADDCGRAWVPVSVDLGRYGGVKLSIFYQPNRRTWRLVLATNVEQGRVDRAYWARPVVESDAAAAREYLTRITQKNRRR
jgi:hypothetical protein